MKKLILFLFICCLLAVFAGCNNIAEESVRQIALMELSPSQQQIVDLFTHQGQEFLVFEYSGDVFTEIEVWIEIYHYGQSEGIYVNLHTISTQPMETQPIAISISRTIQNEFKWSISIGGSRASDISWTAEEGHYASISGSINEPVEIINNEEIILHISKFLTINPSTATTVSTMGNIQDYLLEPELFADFTYVHVIKARFNY